MSFRRGRGVGNGRFSGGRDMDSGRGRGGGRDSGPPRGADRLSNHTSDASMASARIFVGNLPTNDPRLTKELLEENFSQYGHIMGISILKGFGFIQYADEISAENAIRGAQNMEILAHRMDVKNVKSGKDGLPPMPGNSSVSGGSGGGGGGIPDPGNYRDRSPIRRREFDMPMRGREPDMPPRGRDGEMMMRGGPSHRDMDRPSRDFDGRDQRDWGRDQMDMMDPYHGSPYNMDRERDMHPREPFIPPLGDHRGNFGGGGPGPKPSGMNMANEVEIVVTSKTGPLRQYAERIESRIRSQGLAVDVLFPHEEIPIRQVLADLSSRGTLYGIVLSPINPEHGSITLNILFGQPEEHRNIPVEDAFALLSSSLQRYQQQQQGGIGGGGGGGRGGVEQRSGGGGGGGGGLMDSAAPDSRGRGGMQMQAGPEPHHANMQGLINLLQENRPLSVMEYDRLIRYLSDRRDRQMAEDARGGGGLAGSQPAYLLGGGYNSGGAAPGGGGGGGQDNPMELQQRILSILNSSAGGVGTGIVGAGPVPAPVPAPHLNSSALNSSWNAGGEVSSSGQQQQRSNNDLSAGHSDGPKVDGLLPTGPNMLKHYNQSGPGGARQQQQQDSSHRPMQSQQQPGGYYGMGKRF
ncbi:nuclear receptor coactivator 5-like isoform X1 [Daphnia pulicaria]|uniref:nuclear receptor coactivator 5-like isoform X1 n=1 Tax=Daphnia pulicaria TaxID=35523 RepID=UPI001EEC4F74|nr:nuclear receptor coactivator 5-like isoform X1 [Daphnia pulicaria]